MRVLDLVVRVALIAVVSLPAEAAQPPAAPPQAATTLFQNVRIFDGKGAGALRPVARARARQPHRENLRDAHHGRARRRHPRRRRGRPHADARPDRRALARHDGAADARGRESS